MKKDKRPVNLSLPVIMDQPLTAIASIFHRIAGIVLFIAIFILIWALDVALSSEAGFEQIKSLIQTCYLAKFVLWATLTALGYHWIAGIKHLLMDLDIGVTIKGVWVLSIMALIAGISLSILAGVWVW